MGETKMPKNPSGATHRNSARSGLRAPIYPLLVSAPRRRPIQFGLWNLLLIWLAGPPLILLSLRVADGRATLALAELIKNTCGNGSGLVAVGAIVPSATIALTASVCKSLKPITAFVVLVLSAIVGGLLLGHLCSDSEIGLVFRQAWEGHRQPNALDHAILLEILLGAGYLFGAALGWVLSISRNS